WARADRVSWAADETPFAIVPHAVAEIELLSLLTGLELRSLELRAPVIALVRDKEGLANWSTRRSGVAAARPLQLPVIRRFVITDGDLTLVDEKRGMRLEATVESDERADGGEAPAFRLTGDGTLNGQAFDMLMSGGALVNVDRSKPYAFEF